MAFVAVAVASEASSPLPLFLLLLLLGGGGGNGLEHKGGRPRHQLEEEAAEAVEV